VDQLNFFTGKKESSGREGFPAYNGDEMFAYKWRNFKVHFVEQRRAYEPPKRLNVPQVYDLIRDPKEEFDLIPQGFSASWVLPPVSKEIVRFQMTLVAEPPIPFGAPEPWTPSNKK
jgi:arylsulfatase